MANKNIFSHYQHPGYTGRVAGSVPVKPLTQRQVQQLPKPDVTTHHGTAAFKYDAFHELCQIAATGTFPDTTFYGTGATELTRMIELAAQVTDEQLAKLAIYARQTGKMKDSPAALLVLLSKRDTELFHRIFGRVVTNGKMLRNVFQMLRSGSLGRRAMSYSIARAFRDRIRNAMLALAEKGSPWLIHAAIGNDPTYRDILRCLHYKPFTDFERAVNGWLGDYDEKYWAPATKKDLPEVIQAMDGYRKATDQIEQMGYMPLLKKIRWDLLSDAAKGPMVWAELAKNMAPFAMRMNLNTMARHGVFQDPQMVDLVADRLSDPDEVKRGGSFPYSYFMAYQTVEGQVPDKVRKALNAAAELACGNVPALPMPVVVGIDISGSMSSPPTGQRGAATSKASCAMISALFGAAIARANPDSLVVPFNHQAVPYNFDPSRNLLELANEIQARCGGGTDCAIPLKHAMSKYPNRKFGGLIIISDNESWVDGGCMGRTATQLGWEQFKRQQAALGNNFPVKYVGIDIQPYGTCQNKEGTNIMNIGGFSDGVFEVVGAFFSDDNARFVRAVESVNLDGPDSEE